MKSILLTSIAWLLGAGVYAQDLQQYVNPFIGTGGHGHTYPGATMPHGMVQLSPDTRLEGWDGCSGYHYSDTFIYGFSHTHLSGTGVSDYGDVLLMPVSGTVSPDNKKYGSAFSHKDEKASPGFYSVRLLDDNINVELTVTERVGMHRYTFPEGEKVSVILDLAHRDEVIASSLAVVDSVTITGMRRSKAWAVDQHVYFVIKFSSPFAAKTWWRNDSLQQRINTGLSGKNIKAAFGFQLRRDRQLIVKVGLSSVSIPGAIKNLDAELKGWDFDATRSAAAKKWNSELSKIEVESDNADKLSIFYTALYHTAITPNINMDVDSMFRGRDNKIHKADFTNYSVFSLWDTYRAAHPLYTIIDRGRTLDYIKTFLAQYKQGGRLPVWELASNETDCMIGYHSVPVITDAYAKGIRGFDAELALEAMKKSAQWDHLGLPHYRAKGVIETDDEHESVSKTLEYAFDDFCIAVFAGMLGKQKDRNEYMNRAQFYKNVLDVETGFMRPRKNGDWLNPFDPREVNNHYTEANSWQYSFYMPQDIIDYTVMTGGAKELEARLDALFTAPTQTTGRDQSDITGLIGQYAHGNEPSHHIAYLYNYAMAAHKTQQKVHTIMNNFYTNAPDGLIGNEDCGQMSAWYVLSALGFYPVNPAQPKFDFGTPSFNEARIRLENGKTFTISAPELTQDRFYVRRVSGFSGSDSVRNLRVLPYSLIMDGGTIRFTMSDTPTRAVMIDLEQEFKNARSKNKIVVNPVIRGGNVPFKGEKQVVITANDNATIYYTIDGSVPSDKSSVYSVPIVVTETATIKALAVLNGQKSFVTTAHYRKIPHNWHVSLRTPFEKQYDGGGADGLIDGIRGTTDWRKGNWQGYQHQDVDVVIDLTTVKTVSSVTTGFLQDTRAWIVMPKQISIEVSQDSVSFKEVYKTNNFLKVADLQPQIKNVMASFTPLSARYIRIRAMQFGKLPAWHEGAGGDTHIFLDEIMIK